MLRLPLASLVVACAFTCSAGAARSAESLLAAPAAAELALTNAAAELAR